MSRILSSTRTLILVPILGLIFAASLFFVIGGIGLINELSKQTALYTEQSETARARDPAPRRPEDNRKDRPQEWA